MGVFEQDGRGCRLFRWSRLSGVPKQSTIAETVTLEFLAARQRRMLDEIALMRDDIKVLIAIVLCHEETLIRVPERITVTVGQNARIVDRLRVIEERVSRFEEQEQ